jgi:serralysin
MHELLHTLGLKHPHDDGETGRPTFSQLGIGALDIDWATVMSYDDGASWNRFSWDPATPMALDVLALQYIYGKNLTYNAGDTAYTLTESNFYLTLWDAGGVDTLDAGSATKAWTIELPNTTLTTLVDTKVGYAIPTDELFTNTNTALTLFWLTGDYENVIGSAYADSIYGNLFDNSLNGGSGNDTIYGGSGNDIFDWDSSKRSGNDSFFGGLGDDIYVLDSANDSITEYVDEGIDTVWTRFNYSLVNHDNIENLYLFGSGDYVATGNFLDNYIAGNEGDNV